MGDQPNRKLTEDDNVYEKEGDDDDDDADDEQRSAVSGCNKLLVGAQYLLSIPANTPQHCYTWYVYNIYALYSMYYTLHDEALQYYTMPRKANKLNADSEHRKC